jgi:hypothetical protein
MKRGTVRKTFLFNLLFTLIFSTSVFAQTASSVLWPLTDPALNGTGLSPVISGGV